MNTLNTIKNIKEIDDNKVSITLNNNKVIVRNVRISKNDDTAYILFFKRELSLSAINNFLLS